LLEDVLRRARKRAEAKARAELRGRILSQDEASVQLSLPIAEILAGTCDAVEAVAAQAGLLVMQALIAEEVERLAGPRYKHDARCAEPWRAVTPHDAPRRVPPIAPRGIEAAMHRNLLDKWRNAIPPIAPRGIEAAMRHGPRVPTRSVAANSVAARDGRGDRSHRSKTLTRSPRQMPPRTV
jgi:hypothetical protein